MVIRRVHLACLLVASGLIVSANPAPVRGLDGQFTVVELADAEEMRKALGFAADPSDLVQLMAAKDTNFEFGGPLSPDEAIMMGQRIQAERAANPLVEFVMTNPEAFGGVWFEHPNGGTRLLISATDLSSSLVGKAQDLVPIGVDFEIRVVKYSLKELRDAQESLYGQEDTVGITGSYVDITSNELVLGGTSDTVAELGAVLGVPVRAEPIKLVSVACNSRSACTPYRAAIHADFPNMLCTWGFIAKTNLVSQLNIITAGHCATLTQWAKHNGTKVANSVNRNTYDLLGNQQAEALRAPLIESGNLVEPYNLLYQTDTFKNLPLDSKESGLTQTVGETACFVGRTSGNRCGQIHQLGISGLASRFDGQSKFYYNLIRMNRASQSGDSGAPVRYGYTALGMVAFADESFNDYAVYGAIDKVEYAMDVRICIASGCNL